MTALWTVFRSAEWAATCALALAALVTAGEACAQGAQPVEPGPDVDAGLNPGAQRPLWELGLGVAGLRVPDYRGSDRSRNYLLPFPYIVYRGTWLKADRDGARALLFDSGRVKVDISLAASTPTRSRDNDASDARSGMPNLAASAEIGPNLNLALAGSAAQHYRLELRLPLRAAFTVERSPRGIGGTFSPNLNLDLGGRGGITGGWNVGLLTGPVFADRKYHQYYYGVDPAYATPTRPAYSAPGGYAGWRALAAASQRFGDTWVGAFLRYDGLHGAAFDNSPLVRRYSSVTVGIGASWVLWKSSTLVQSTD